MIFVFNFRKFLGFLIENVSSWGLILMETYRNMTTFRDISYQVLIFRHAYLLHHEKSLHRMEVSHGKKLFRQYVIIIYDYRVRDHFDYDNRTRCLKSISDLRARRTHADITCISCTR